MKSEFTIRSAAVEDQTAIEAFIEHAAAVHRHLDWRSPSEWIGRDYFLILEQGRRIQALLVCTAEPNQVQWIRVFACASHASLARYWSLLFLQLSKAFSQRKNKSVIASITYLDWMKDLLSNNHWKIQQTIVQLRWKGTPKNKFEQIWSQKLKIQPMQTFDLDSVSQIDNVCFTDLWQQSKEAIERAFEQSNHATVAILDGYLAGFQISTSHKSVAHLARLAVDPKFQGKYIGQALVQEMLTHFRKPWIREITVNTQQDNAISLNLYRKMGFELTGDSFPIYVLQADQPSL